MSRFRYHDEDTSLASMLGSLTVGLVAGFAVGVVVAQKTGGLSGLTARLREGIRGITGRLENEEDEGLEAIDDENEDEDFDDQGDTVLEERVLEAFRNDPILCERAVDIGAIGDGVIELAGWVNTKDEANHAVTVARGTPGVDTVVNRLAVGDEEDLLEDNARRFEDGDPALTEARWEGQRVGTGRRRQGTSAEPDRHADPKPQLEERWLDEEHALRDAAEETIGIAERKRTAKKTHRGSRTDGSAVTPTGVPKADHVAERLSPPQSAESESDPDRAD